MKRLIQIIIFMGVILVCNFVVAAQMENDCLSQTKIDDDNQLPLTVEANLLLKEPKCYDGKFIRTFGFYRYGFEMSLLFCMDCGNTYSAWFNTSNFNSIIDRCTPKKDLKKVASKKDKVLGVVVLGVLKTKGGYGVRNAHDIEFSPICFERVDFLTDNSGAPFTSGPETIKRMRDWYKKMSEIYSKN